jgi:predicted translin family RNA/ssDNA-binding protein
MKQTQDFVRKAIMMGLNHAHSDIAGEKGSILLEEMSVNDVRNAMSDYDFVMCVYKELKSIGEFRKSW